MVYKLQQSINLQNKIKNKLLMKAINYACFKLEENRLDLIDLLKRIKIILSTLKEINLPSVIDKEN